MGDKCSYDREVLDSITFRLAISTLYSVAALVTTVLNSLILISIWKTPSLHKPSYILIASLALSDLLVGAVGEPLIIIGQIAALRKLSWEIYCLFASKYAESVSYTLATISLWTLTFISLDRLLTVKLMNRYQSVVTQKRVFCVLLMCWVTVCTASATLFGFSYQNDIALIFVLGIGAFILVLFITVFYSMAFHILRKIISVSPCVQNPEAVARPSSNIDVAKYRKSLVTVSLVFLCTILCYTPFVCSCLSIHSNHSSLHTSRKAQDISYIIFTSAEVIALFNSAMNPLLYLWRMRDIREAVKNIVKRALKIF